MSNNGAESPKWVTFHDVMDDAMEGGKLLPIKRRSSNSQVSGSLTSSLSSSSLESKFEFSQSLGYGEIKEAKKIESKQRSSSTDNDKYAIFSKLDKSQTPKGWSGKVLHQQSPMGWSSEILGLDDEPKVEEEDPWTAHLTLHRSTWDRSPNRSFVRNFP